jgi:RadC-like JAB domain
VPVQCLTGQMLTQRDDHKRALRTAPHHRPQLRRPESKCAANQRVSHTAFLVHNHPSGDPTPSRADIEMTRDHGGGAPARHCRARPHHRRQRRARQPEGAEADLMSSIALQRSGRAHARSGCSEDRFSLPTDHPRTDLRMAFRAKCGEHCNGLYRSTRFERLGGLLLRPCDCRILTALRPPAARAAPLTARRCTDG